MKIFALLSWFDEDPEHLRRCVSSCGKLCDAVIAVDGAYATFPGADEHPTSYSSEYDVIYTAASTAGMGVNVFDPSAPWPGGEVEKRAFMFQYARDCGATPDDWLLIIDGDMEIANVHKDARDRLNQATDLDVAGVNWHDIRQDGNPTSTLTFRSLYRAVPGLTVEGTHWLYTAPDDDGGRRYLWHAPSGNIAAEPALDMTAHITLHHYNLHRDVARAERARLYYRERDAAGLESPVL